MASNNNEILMLDAPAETTRPWRSSTNAQIIDALPYIDDDYGNPKVKAEVDRLVEEEMRRSSKKPADFLIDLPPLPKSNFQNNPMLAREYERVRAGRPPVRHDFSRLEIVDLPPANKINDETAWKHAVQRAQRNLQYQTIRLENLDLMSKYGPEVWKQNNLRLETLHLRMQKLAQELSEKIETVNRERKFHQQNTAFELGALSGQWNELCLKNIEIQTACANLDSQTEELKREALERGWNVEANSENSSLLLSTLPLEGFTSGATTKQIKELSSHGSLTCNVPYTAELYDLLQISLMTLGVCWLLSISS
ncbi:hypothetical protein ACFE04_012850 [Oxalis oulophora]